jgi:hypothetical protein
MPSSVKALLQGKGVLHDHLDCSGSGDLTVNVVEYNFSIDNKYSMHPVLVVNSTISYEVDGLATARDRAFPSILFLHRVNDLWFVNPAEVDATAVNLDAMLVFGRGESSQVSVGSRTVLHSVMDQESGERVVCYDPTTNKSSVDNSYGIEVILRGDAGSLLTEGEVLASDLWDVSADNHPNRRVSVFVSYKLPLHMRYASLCAEDGAAGAQARGPGGSGGGGSARADLNGISLSTIDRKFLNRVGYISSVMPAPEVFVFARGSVTADTAGVASLTRVWDSQGGECAATGDAVASAHVLSPCAPSSGTAVGALAFVAISQPYMSFNFVYRMNFVCIMIACGFIIYMIVKRR